MSLKKLGRYDLLRVLGKGAMGLVYEGRDPNLNRRVAVKTIKVDNLSDEAAAEYEVRFRNEAHSAGRLQHPNIVSVYDSDRDGDIAFLVLEFVEGNDLKHHLDKGEVFTLTQTLDIMTDLLSALGYAHHQKIVHRDVKPANLLVQPGGRIKLADFGVARIQDSGDLTRTQGSIVGTLKYMSPEQLEGRPIDARADLFAAGVVLYQLLTGKRPFDGDTDFAVIQNIVGVMPPSVTLCNPGLPPALDAVVATALAKSRERRFSSADEFLDALRLACKDAVDATIAPQRTSPISSTHSTWTSTMVAGESLVHTRPGASTGTDTNLNRVLLAQEVELLYWKDIRESSEQPDIEQFLVKFPQGIYADLARRKLKLLDAGLPGDSATAMDTRRAESQTTALPPATQQVSADLAPRENGVPAFRPKAASASGEKSVLTATARDAEAPAKKSAKSGSKSGSNSGSKGPVVQHKTHPAVWALVAVASVALLVAALKITRTGSPSVAVAGAASAPMSAASAASASLGLGPGETAVVSFGSDAGAAKSPAAAAAASTAAVSTPAATSTAIFGVSLASSASAAVTPSAASASAAAKPALSPASMAQRQAAAAARAASAAAASRRLMPEFEPVAKEEPAPAAPVAAKPKAVTPPVSNAIAACEGRVLISFQICMAEQCAKPAFAQQAACMERRQMDERRREADRFR